MFNWISRAGFITFMEAMIQSYDCWFQLHRTQYCYFFVLTVLWTKPKLCRKQLCSSASELSTKFVLKKYFVQQQPFCENTSKQRRQYNSSIPLVTIVLHRIQYRLSVQRFKSSFQFYSMLSTLLSYCEIWCSQYSQACGIKNEFSLRDA